MYPHCSPLIQREHSVAKKSGHGVMLIHIQRMLSIQWGSPSHHGSADCIDLIQARHGSGCHPES